MTTKSIYSAVAVTLFAASALAQAPAPVSPGWSAYSGCWQPIPAEGLAVLDAPIVCVVPSGNNGADLVSISGNQITERTRIEADGRQHDVAKQGCAGWESASFSPDGRRLYVTSDQQCAGIKRRATGLFGMTSNGQWVHVINVAADGGEGLRVSRYGRVTLTPDMPAEVYNTLSGRALADRTARVAAQARVTPDVVIEASKALSAAAVEAWLAELEQTFTLDAATLVKLADQGVPPSIIDVMVAVSNPAVFAVKATGGGVMTSALAKTSPTLSQRNQCVSPVMIDPFGYYDYDPCDPFRRYGYYNSRRYGYGRDPYFGYGLYDPYSYGSSYYGNGYGRPVTIVVIGSQKEEHGRMTKDGYKRSPTTSTGTSSTSGSSSSDSRSGSSSSSSGSSSSGSSSSGSSSAGSSSSGERTATRKPPTG